MSYINEGCDKYTSAQIQSWIDSAEQVLKVNIENNKNKDRVEFIQSLRQQLVDLHADLILKRQEEMKAREEMKRSTKQIDDKAETKELLKNLSQMVESL